ncbi:Na+/H+ antiporter NhaD/arsenite permease-like protein [Breznakia pachnodae]|uniref:Na+/H+ antiporter NhaD/arsenite permease-like protein n=1 Tax=Breznakia pachnodae TaxID=265178 RepID=A0ABU0E4J8_9FIRM|nr:Na+/H+ antiporter NhaD/arsenite permease-like protein [Breznakia pachnodae]
MNLMQMSIIVVIVIYTIYFLIYVSQKKIKDKSSEPSKLTKWVDRNLNNPKLILILIVISLLILFWFLHEVKAI